VSRIQRSSMAPFASWSRGSGSSMVCTLRDLRWRRDRFLPSCSIRRTAEWIASPKRPLRSCLAAGAFERDTNGNGGDILETTRQLRDVLLAKGYNVHYQQFTGRHDGLSWRGLLADGLIALLVEP